MQYKEQIRLSIFIQMQMDTGRKQILYSVTEYRYFEIAHVRVSSAVCLKRRVVYASKDTNTKQNQVPFAQIVLILQF